MKTIYSILIITGIFFVINTLNIQSTLVDLDEYTWELEIPTDWTKIDEQEIKKQQKYGQKFIDKAGVKTNQEDESYNIVLQLKKEQANTILATVEFDNISNDLFWSEYVVSRINETNKVFKTLSKDVTDHGVKTIYIDNLKFAHSKVTVAFPKNGKEAYFNTYITKLNNGFLSVITTAMNSEYEQEIESIINDSLFLLKPLNH